MPISTASNTDNCRNSCGKPSICSGGAVTVSYTHLDVYKRQGVSIADSSEHIALDAEQVAQITFSEDVSASASYETNNAEEIEQIVDALQQLKLQKIDTATFEADLTEESIDTFVWLQYADEARAEEQNADIVFFFCKNGTVGVQQADNLERYYQVDHCLLYTSRCV